MCAKGIALVDKRLWLVPVSQQGFLAIERLGTTMGFIFSDATTVYDTVVALISDCSAGRWGSNPTFARSGSVLRATWS